MNLKRILCFVGIHKYGEEIRKDASGMKSCIRCNKQVFTVYAVMESDLRKMLDDGKISFAGYSSAIKKGYLEKSDFELKDDFFEEI